VRSMRSHTDRSSRSCSVITSTSRPVDATHEVVHPPNGINQETITPPCRGISLCT
jgi:hypothetical protein